MAALTGEAAAGRTTVRFANNARVLGNVASILLRRAEQLAHGMSDEVGRQGNLQQEISHITDLLANPAQLSALAREHTAELKAGAADEFDWSWRLCVPVIGWRASAVAENLSIWLENGG